MKATSRWVKCTKRTHNTDTHKQRKVKKNGMHSVPMHGARNPICRRNKRNKNAKKTHLIKAKQLNTWPTKNKERFAWKKRRIQSTKSFFRFSSQSEFYSLCLDDVVCSMNVVWFLSQVKMIVSLGRMMLCLQIHKKTGMPQQCTVHISLECVFFARKQRYHDVMMSTVYL